MTGTVARIVADKGYGFIRGADGQDRFFLATQLVGHPGVRIEDLVRGAKVEFEHEDHEKGARAKAVKVVQ